jgi:glutathione S-transferase
VKLYDAPRCPFCARVRMALAEKGVAYETVEIDLDHRPAWIYDLNATGKVPVLENGFVLPESAVIMEYLEECFPETPLLPPAPDERAEARLEVYRFDDTLGDDWYAFRRGEPNAVEEKLAALPVGESLFVDVAFAPWVIRAREQYGLSLSPRVGSWLDEVGARPAFAAEIDVVRAFA